MSTSDDARRAPDGGYTMLEVVIAMAVFTILAGSVFTVLTGALRVTGDNNRRTVAADLASAQIEQARSQRALDIPDGLTTRTQTVGGTTYTVAQTANYLASDATNPVCVGSGDTLAYKLVSVRVTWPGMGTTRAVSAKTLRALQLGSGGLAAGSGSLAVVVQGANGDVVTGSVVALSPGGAVRTTGSDGCAVFAGLDPGTYRATVDQPGRVASSGYQAASTADLVVSAGQVTRASLFHDVARTQPFVLEPPAGYQVPAGVPVVLRDSFIADTTAPACGTAPVRSCATGVPGELQGLFPDTYALWAGTCSDADDAPASFDATQAAGGATPVGVPLGGVAVTVTRAGVPTSGTPLYAVHQPENAEVTGSQCPTGEVYALGTSGAAPTATALPFGEWTITTDPAAPAGTGPVVLLDAAHPTSDVAVVLP
ncbi:prepilin-type N-terminal cleavage/methylation domain-containing protein [Quadrisphaera sp. KR29]|uniref:prepilin-type N-terminal cleavage/methylation domain-containing protein n=1 Tax=Quadrisphaera sp. KR29 TaxID=3461391 RepID=UPI004043C52B